METEANQHEPTVLEKVRRALGRTRAMAEAPVPPAIGESFSRLVRSDADLVEVFTARAADLKMKVATVSAEEVYQQIAAFLREHNCRRIAVSTGGLMQRLDLANRLSSDGFTARAWDQMTLDELYEYDAAVTDVAWAVAETGSLVIKPDAGHGRGLSLVPMVHVAVVEQNNLVPDLLDLMQKVNADGVASNIILISGPSKTADIEMNVVTGVHGPNVVKAFVLK